MAARIKGITVEIGGDTSNLQKALKGVNNEIGSTQAQLKDVERLLKLDPTNTNLLEQRQRLLGNAVQATSEKLDALKAAEKQVQEQFQKGEATQEQYEGLQREIIATEAELKKLEKAAENAGVAMQKIVDAGQSLQKTGEKIAGVGSSFSKAVTLPIAAAGTAAAKMSMDVEDAIAKVSTIADTNVVSLEKLESGIMGLSNQFGISAAEMADNVYNAISASVDTANAVEFVEKSTKLAKAGFAESGAALDILTTIMNAYGLAADKVTDVSDILIQTQNLGKTTVAELSKAMGKVIPTAKAQNVELDDLAAAYAVMTANGVATAETTTYLNSMLNELGKDGTSAFKAFAKGTENIKEGGLTMAEAMESGWELTDVLEVLAAQAEESGTTIANMFGSAEAGKAAAILYDNAEKVDDAVVQMRESAGATDAAFEKMQTTSFTMQATLTQLQNVMIEFGSALMDVLAPIIEKVAQSVENLTEWFGGLDDGTKETIVTVALAVAAIGPLLLILGKVITVVGTVLTLFPKIKAGIDLVTSGIQFLIANPIVLLIAAIVALVALIAAKGDEIQGILQRVDDFLQGIFARDWTQVFGPVLGTALNTFLANVKNIWDAVKMILDGIVNFIRGIFTGDWSRAWEGVKQIFSGVFNGLVAIAKAPLNAVIGLINGMVAGINWVIGRINSISVDLPSWLGGGHIGFSIPTLGSVPYLAKGGILSQGSAIVGEAGPELLTMMGDRAMVQPLTGGDKTTNLGGVNITVYGAPGQSVDDLADVIMEKMKFAVQRREAVF